MHGKWNADKGESDSGASHCHVLVDLQSSVPLIGASGAVSGVMAMYLGIFRLKKIEFFYWFFVLVLNRH